MDLWSPEHKIYVAKYSYKWSKIYSKEVKKALVKALLLGHRQASSQYAKRICKETRYKYAATQIVCFILAHNLTFIEEFTVAQNNQGTWILS